uniref:NADH-ubiquinone oxidoreductase chain 5 n=1 Tax=Ophioplocus japonicus TaxID=35056 RepID=A0A513X088_9ECHI|nr:NADH dehydrogenase subunit 5 [Ophioplocus japonicus]QDH07343.1 NADH dehydrogenase subunit 5 [Ophioplocus japonicus]
MLLNISIFLTTALFLSYSFLNKSNNKSKITISLLGGLAAVGGFLVLAWIILDYPSHIITLNWFNPSLNYFSLSFYLDPPTIIFSGVALYVTWSIIEFSHYYMNTDNNNQEFFNTLTLFLLFMLILVSSNSLFLLFIGWEGVGILSFILIGWWFTRSDANSAAIQAIIYNRIGDSGMIIFLAFSIIHLNSWELNEVLFLNEYSPISNWAILGIIIAAIGKSAQFGLHPWLPAAMEGPTPVSALLHSSTMVVAGVFLLFRSFPLLNTSNWAPPLISIIGATTALFAASAALVQYDIKKIIAYSTTSQLGLMVVAIGIKLPNLALFHICTHAFFKALLFLCSGSTIHSLNNEQDLRKASNTTIYLPFTTSCIIIGSLALCGLPFLAGFYSKDLILEASQNTITNSLSIILSLIATLMTALYSFRLIYYISKPPSSNNLIPSSEENLNLITPLLRLLIGVFIAGWVLTIVTFNNPPIIITWINKSLPLILTISAMVYIFNNLSPKPFNNLAFIQTNKFLSNNWFFVNITHNTLFPFSFSNSINGVLRSLDQGWTSQLGPTGASTSLTSLTNILQNSQTGLITHYISYSLIIIIGIIIPISYYLL